ncbi:MAG TPA: NAD-dependent epimerase/dehydratase family protein [Polyangiaceae bacterium]|nr:NAD-dependent epimerase/dehydratase family protein [Polyangiaceae bacterium]
MISERIPVARRVGQLLITGAPGWLADRLLASFVAVPLPGLARVRCLVRAGLAVDAGDFARQTGAEVDVVRGDLRDRRSLEAAVRGVDTVLHAAGILHVRRTQDFYDVNTEGTLRLAEAAAEGGVGRFVFVSSNAAGGRSDSAARLLTEEDAPRPLSHYGRSKWLAEAALLGLPGAMQRVILRPCMFYGPPVPPRHVEVFRRVLHGRMPLVGGGKYARSVTHIDHLVQATRLALLHPAAAGRTYYVADPRVYTTREVVEAMGRALGVRPRWLPLPGLTATVAHELDTQIARLGAYWQTLHLVGEANWHVGVAIDRARRELGYDPRFDIDHGMREAVEWCRRRGLLEPKGSDRLGARPVEKEETFAVDDRPAAQVVEHRPERGPGI